MKFLEKNTKAFDLVSQEVWFISLLIKFKLNLQNYDPDWMKNLTNN